MRRKFIAMLLTITFLSGCMSNAVKESNEQEFFGEVIKGNKTIEDFMLLTSENDTYNFKNRTEGKVVVIAFLFTNCYDICPVVTYNMRMMQESFNQTVLDSVEFITITVDPWRDNVTTLHEWKTRTKSNWTHLTVNDTESDSDEMKTLNAVWANFD
ncbi:MAG: SCO family protein, partial [Candidatus Thermoplasmatota archaeon]|nr:SCO family protein [Candidatus Thermoplasmatota archaeon]